MLHQPFQRLPAQIEPVELGIAPLQPRHDPQCLGVVVEPAMAGHAFGQCILPRMAEGGVAEIMRESECFGQILVEPERPGQSAGDLRHLDRMGQPGAEVVAVRRDEDLRLVLQPAEGRGMDDAVAVTLENGCGSARPARPAAARG